MNALCIVVDGLRSGFLGCYGNTWVQTPAIDRLATQGFVFDQALIESPQLGKLYRSYWLVPEADAPGANSGSTSFLLKTLAAAGVTNVLVTDEPNLAEFPSTDSLDEVVQLPAAVEQAAASSEDTQLAAVFSAAADWIEAARSPFCLWLHAKGMYAAWDAPLPLRQQFAEGEDVPIPSFAAPPCAWGEHPDPDELLALRWAYAAQTIVLDRCLEAFFAWFDAQPAAREALVVLIGARGYPLGEHARVGLAAVPDNATSLHEELIHVPCLVRMPGREGAADRSQTLVVPLDLASTLADWFQLSDCSSVVSGQSWLPFLRGLASSHRDYVCQQTAAGERAIRTPAWHLIVPALPSAPRALYAKPDDRWEMNEVASRCADIADLLSAALEERQQTVNRPLTSTLSPLPDVLLRGQE